MVFYILVILILAGFCMLIATFFGDKIYNKSRNIINVFTEQEETKEANAEEDKEKIKNE